MDDDPRRPVLHHFEVDLDICIVQAIDSADFFSDPRAGSKRPLLTLAVCRAGKETDGRSFWSRPSTFVVKLGARVSRKAVEFWRKAARRSVEDVLVEASLEPRSMAMADACSA